MVTDFFGTLDFRQTVGLSVPADGEVWHEVTYDAQVEQLPAPGWFVHRLTGTIGEDRGYGYFRLKISPGAVPPEEVQIGRGKLVGRREAP